MGFIRKVERDALTGDIELAVIGKAMALSQAWLLDSDLGIVEDNFAEGEIVIGGEGVAQGYYKDETKTADAFIWWNGRRVYKTGDYGRWVPARGVSQDRVFEFRGRRDRTVKNRGFLVNLDRDVEDCLYRAGASLGVRSVRAAMAENGIVAVVSPSWVDTTVLLTHAKQSMYAYCIPYRIVAVDDFPLSPNGKAQLRNILDIFVAVDQAGMDQTPHATIGKETRTPTDSAGKQEPETAQGKLEKILWAATEVLRQPGEELRKIRPEQTFVEVGGSSLLALKLVSSLRQLDLNVSVRDLFACHTFSDIADLASTTTLSKDTANLNLGKDSKATPELPRIPANLTAQVRTALNLAADEDIEVAPLTSLQLELAIPTLAETSRSVNQVRLSYKGVWAGAMERAWRAAWQSEPVFKAQICLDVGSGVQVVRKRAPKAPTREVFHSRQQYDTAVGGSSMAVGLGARLDFLAYQPPGVASDETSGTDEESLTIVLTVHHSLMDGCSLKLLLDKLEQAALGWPFGTSPSPVHANLALISTQQSRDAEARAFFHSYLKDMPLPLPRRRSSAVAGRQHQGIAKAALLESSVDIDEVTAFASSHCVSAACVYYTAWAMAMSVFERCPQVVVGAVFSSRGALPAEHEDALGLYMSTLPLVFRFEDTNETVVARLQHTMGDLTTVGEYAWARSDQVGLGRNLRNLLSMQLPLPGDHSRPPAVLAESLENSDFPLSMLVEANGSLRLLYDETQFDTTTVRRLGEHFKYALSGLIREHRVEDCMRISRLHETLFDYTEDVGIESDERFTVKRALEEAMDQFADLPALEDCTGTTVLSYGELDRLTEIITHRINALCGDTSQNNRPIAVHGDGSVDWVLGTLAVVRTGRTFVPLDPKWPMGRRAAVCEQSGATALILVPRASQIGEAPAIPGMRVLAVDSILSSSAEPSSNTPGPLDDAPSPDDLLTIVFTSGTTGAPKGVPLSHQGFLALQSTPEGRMFAAPGRRVAQFMSPAFDVCNAEMFSTLLHGATLILRDPLDPFAHLARVNTASMTPSVLATLELDRFPSLEVVSHLFFPFLPVPSPSPVPAQAGH
jgi:non-ribosomal peptide synthetase component F